LTKEVTDPSIGMGKLAKEEKGAVSSLNGIEAKEPVRVKTQK